MTDSQKNDDLEKLLRQFEKRRELSARQWIGILLGSLILIIGIGPIGVILLGTTIGPVASSVFIAVIIIFLVQNLQTSNMLQARKTLRDEPQESLDDTLASEK